MIVGGYYGMTPLLATQSRKKDEFTERSWRLELRPFSMTLVKEYMDFNVPR